MFRQELASKRFSGSIEVFTSRIDRRLLLRKIGFLASVATLFLFAHLASAQQADASFGLNALMSPGAESCNFNTGCPEKGGIYPSIGADVIFHRRLGLGFDVAWRGGQGNYGGSGRVQGGWCGAKASASSCGQVWC